MGGLPAPSFQPWLKGRNHERLALQVGAEAHLAVVHREVDDAAAELEEQLPRVAVALVLLDGVLDGLLGQAVLQLEGGDRQAVDEQAQVERTAASRRGCSASWRVTLKRFCGVQRSAALALPGDGVP